MEKKLLLGDEAIALGAIHAGIRGVYAYPGTPSTEITEYIQRHPLARARGLHSTWCTNEKTAVEAALGASYAGARVIACMKHVGLNVAADAFVNAAITGVNGGMIVVVADDPSMHSSQNEQDSRFYGKFSMITTLEPSTQQEAYDMMQYGFELSEREKLPVLMRIVMRLAHSRAAVTVKEEAEEVRALPCAKDPASWVLLPANSRRKYAALVEQQPRLEQAAAEAPYTRYEQASGEKPVGILACGIGYNYVTEVREAAEKFNILKITQYPLPADLVRRLAADSREILVVEDGQPFAEELVRGDAFRRLSRTRSSDGRLAAYGGTDTGQRGSGYGTPAGALLRSTEKCGGTPACLVPGMRPPRCVHGFERSGKGISRCTRVCRHRLLYIRGFAAFPCHRHLPRHGGFHYDGQRGGRRRCVSGYRCHRRFHVHPFRHDGVVGCRKRQGADYRHHIGQSDYGDDRRARLCRYEQVRGDLSGAWGGAGTCARSGTVA